MRYSKQREAVWDYLKDRKDHPTADQIYEAVRQNIPGISLGTVYRNLMQLKDIGKIRTVEVGDGVVHFDPDVSLHDHFLCRECGRVLDLTVGKPQEILKNAANHFPGQIDGYSAFFYGLCEDCLRKQNNKESQQNAEKGVES